MELRHTLLRNKYFEKDIWIVGSGKSLDFIDSEFFKGKIVLGVNQVWKKPGLKLNYNLLHHPFYLKEAAEAGNHVLLIPDHELGDTGFEKIDMSWCEEKAVFRYTHKKWKPETPELLKMNLDAIGMDDDIFSQGTVASAAMHLAAYFGAKNIILVGFDSGTIGDQLYFEGYHEKIILDRDLQFFGSMQKTLNWMNQMVQINEEMMSILRARLKEVYGCRIYSLNPFLNLGLEGHTYSKKLTEAIYRGWK